MTLSNSKGKKEKAARLAGLSSGLRAIKRSLTKKKFLLQTIPHKLQRYDTVGDWIPGSPAKITVSQMGNDDYEFLVMVHELVEFYLCQKRGIGDKEVSAFDIKFEKNRAKEIREARKRHRRSPSYLHWKHGFLKRTIDAINSKEPGDDPKAPYFKEHQFATMIEKALCRELKVDWRKYDKTIMSL